MSWRLAHSLSKLQSELDSAYPHRTKPDWTIGDAAHRGRGSDHNPNPSGVVCAIDVRGRAVAQQVWKTLLKTRDTRVKYAIFDRKIVNSTVSPWQVRNYSGSNPHTDHIHISVGRGPSGSSTRADLYDSRSSWGFSSAGGSVSNEDEDDVVLKRGDKGNAVRAFQNALLREGEVAGRGNVLPRFGADGDFGAETESAVSNYQRAANVQRTGQINGVTAALLARYITVN